MRLFSQKIAAIAAIAGIISLTYTGVVSAHVVVKPAEAVTSGFLTFTAGVPNEKDINVTKLELLIPEGLNYVQPAVKTGWNITTKKEGSGENAKIVSITWDKGTIPSGFRDDFTFSAQVPKNTTELQWKAYQTYADGTTVAWDQAGEEKSETKGPFSVTKVVAKTQTELIIDEAKAATDTAKGTADSALYIGIASLLVSLGAIYFSSKSR